MKKYIFARKSQFMVFSAFFLILLLFFIYSLETVNTYKVTNGDFIHISEFDKKICNAISSRNGTDLNSSILIIENSMNIYCSNDNRNCLFDIYNITPIPPLDNWSYLNISQFEVNYYSNTSWFKSNITFRCE